MALQAKKPTRSSEGKQEALDALSEEEKVRLNLDIPQSTMRRLKILALERETTVSGIVRELISEVLSE